MRRRISTAVLTAATVLAAIATALATVATLTAGAALNDDGILVAAIVPAAATLAAALRLHRLVRERHDAEDRAAAEARRQAEAEAVRKAAYEHDLAAAIARHPAGKAKTTGTPRPPQRFDSRAQLMPLPNFWCQNGRSA